MKAKIHNSSGNPLENCRELLHSVIIDEGYMQVAAHVDLKI